MSEPQNLAPVLARLSEQVAALHTIVSRIERNQSDPEETRQALSDVAGGYALLTQLAEVAGVQRTQILELTTTLSNRVPGDELRAALHDELFTTKQLTSIMQGTRDDLVLLRADVRRLAALLEQAARARVIDATWSGEERRKAS